MAYNKARAEKEWLEWKNKEETELRELGLDEDTMNSFLEIIWILAKLHLLVAILLDLEITLLLEKSITNLALHHMR